MKKIESKKVISSISRDKFFWILSLFFSSVIFISIVVGKYKRYQVDFPIGWDPPMYVGAANLIIEKGPLSWMLERNEFCLYYLFLAFLGSIFNNTKLMQIILQTLVSLFMIYTFSNLVLTFTKSYRTASITALVVPLTQNFVHLYIVPSQISALSLLCLIISKLDYIVENFKLNDRKSIVLTIFGAAIFWIHSIFTFIPFILIISFVYFFTHEHRYRMNLLKFGTLSLIIGIIPQIPLLPSLIQKLTIESNSLWLMVKPKWDFYIINLLSFGTRYSGNDIIFIFVILGIFILLDMLMKKKKSIVVLGILSWSIISLSLFHLPFLFYSFWPLWNIFARRAIMIFPVSILLSLSLDRIYISLKNWCSIYLSTRIQINFLNVICTILLILSSAIIIVPSFLSLTEHSWRPWIDKGDYSQILFVKDELKRMNIIEEPIFIFYKIYPDLIDYMQNILDMEIGSHYSYYGKLEFLLSGQKTPSNYFKWMPEEEYFLANVLWNRMTKNEIVDNISSHPIIIISTKFYPESQVSSYNFEKYYIRNGVYIIPPYMGKELAYDTIICYRDYNNITLWGGGWGFYESIKNWSIAKYVLTLYLASGRDPIPMEVDFPIYIRHENIIIRLHLYDYNEKYAPINFYLDEDLVFIFNYSGTEKPIMIEFPIKSSIDIKKDLRIIIQDTLPQILSLDVIEIYIDDN